MRSSFFLNTTQRFPLISFASKNLNFEYVVMPGDTTIVSLPPFESSHLESIDSNKGFFKSFIQNTIKKSKSILKQIPIVGPTILNLYRKSVFYPYDLSKSNITDVLFFSKMILFDEKIKVEKKIGSSFRCRILSGIHFWHPQMQRSIISKG